MEDVPYNVDPSRIRLGPGAAAGLSRLHAAGFLLIVVSNQSGVARGMFPEEALTLVHKRLAELLADFGVPLHGFFYCPHHPEGNVARYAVNCSCRKPEPGMIRAAAREYGVSLTDSWLVGDILDDVEAGRRAGCRTVLLDNGHETIWRRSALRQPDFLAADLEEAARLIIAHNGGQKTFDSSPHGAAW